MIKINNEKIKKSWHYLISLRYVKLASYISAKSLKNKYLYYYGFNIVYGAINKGLLLILAGVLFHALPQILLAALAFMTLRGYIGGLHFDSYTKCAWVSLCTLVGVGLLAKYMPYNNLVNIIVFISLSFIILKYAPIEHYNRLLKESDKGNFKCIALCLLIAIYCAELLKGNSDISNCIMYGVLLSGIIALPIFKKVK